MEGKGLALDLRNICDCFCLCLIDSHWTAVVIVKVIYYVGRKEREQRIVCDCFCICLTGSQEKVVVILEVIYVGRKIRD